MLKILLPPVQQNFTEFKSTDGSDITIMNIPHLDYSITTALAHNVWTLYLEDNCIVFENFTASIGDLMVAL
jgi:hypothetical protein